MHDVEKIIAPYHTTQLFKKGAGEPEIVLSATASDLTQERKTFPVYSNYG